MWYVVCMCMLCVMSPCRCKMASELWYVGRVVRVVCGVCCGVSCMRVCVV